MHKSGITNHIAAVHEGKNPYSCTECNSKFAYKDGLKRHIILMHHVGNLKTHNCTLCGKTFELKQYLNSHLISVHEGKRPFKCDVCFSDFPSMIRLKLHIEAVHEGRKPFSCTKCDAMFAYKNGPKRHSIVHDKFKIFQCLLCPKQCGTNQNLSAHINAHERKSRKNRMELK